MGRYKGTFFHRMTTGFMLQGGDILNGDGTGSVSIYGDKFDDENFKVKRCQYAVSMGNSGPNTNGCQFFICTDECSELNGKHVVFGFVADKKSQKLVDEMEAECAQPASIAPDGQPAKPCKITKSGVKKQ